MQFVLETLTHGSPLPLLADAKGTALLSQREQDVVRGVAEGLSNREIAERLNLSKHTIKNHIFHVFDKLGLSTRVELVLYVCSQRASATQLSGNMVEQTGAPPRDGVAVVAWHRNAAEHGSGIAQLMLGEIYRDGRGVAKDKISAYMWFLLAEKQCNDISSRGKAARDRLSERMQTDQISEAERRASEWLKKHQKHSAPLSLPSASERSRFCSPIVA
jgi:DNA-binding CsgD family transcriptional regulator